VKRGLIVLVLLSGCYHGRIVTEGYPVYQRYNAIGQAYVCQRHGIVDGACVCQCRHAKSPYFQQEWVAPIYAPVFVGVDCQGNQLYQNQLVRGGFFKEVFAGYYCTLCGRKL
jgi:hypothetical protein